MALKRAIIKRKTALKQKTPLRTKSDKKRRTNREIDEKFLSFVRSQDCAVPCCDCKPIHAHHLKSRGAGGSDYTAVALCWKHHSEVHCVSFRRFEDKYKVDLWGTNVDLLEKWKEKQ